MRKPKHLRSCSLISIQFLPLSCIMTPYRTEKVDLAKKNRITKKTNRQEESPEETRKKQKKIKTAENAGFDFFLIFFFVFFLFFPWFWFSSLFFLFALVLFFFYFCQTLYSLCCWTHKARQHPTRCQGCCARI